MTYTEVAAPMKEDSEIVNVIRSLRDEGYEQKTVDDRYKNTVCFPLVTKMHTSESRQMASPTTSS